MRKRERTDIPPKSGRLKDGCVRYGLGESTMREIAERAGAAFKVGRSYLINFDKMDQYIDKLTTGGGADDTKR